MRGMKKVLATVLVFTGLFMALAGCANNESEALKLVHDMMALDYETMSVGDFNTAIEKLCEDADTTVSAVYHDVSAEFTTAGELYGPPDYGDEKLAGFMIATLQYSSTEIYAANTGDAAEHMGVVMYMTVPGMTANEVATTMAGDAEAAAKFATENAETLNIYPLLTYFVEETVHDPSAVTVSERDERINSAHAAVKETFLSLGEDVIMADTLEENLLAEFERLSAAYSDDAMTVRCVIQGVEREGDLEVD